MISIVFLLSFVNMAALQHMRVRSMLGSHFMKPLHTFVRTALSNDFGIQKLTEKCSVALRPYSTSNTTESIISKPFEDNEIRAARDGATDGSDSLRPRKFPADNFRDDSSRLSYKNSFDPKLVDGLLQQVDNDMPLPEMQDPFEKVHPRCFLCRNNITLDHKNVRLLSQFVSPYTGRIYGRAITGLCIPMQKQVAKYIKRARMSGYMPFILKDPKYLNDPQPYDPMVKKMY